MRILLRDLSTGPATPISAILRYNGAEFSRRMVAQLDRGSISVTDFGRVIGLNKLKASQIPGAQGGPVTPEVASRHQCPSRIGRKNRGSTLVREVMSTVPPGDKDLSDLYHVRGNADPILVATALDAIAKSEETLLIEDWQIVTDDEGVKKKASEFDLRTVTSAEFKKLVGGTATGNGSN